MALSAGATGADSAGRHSRRSTPSALAEDGPSSSLSTRRSANQTKTFRSEDFGFTPHFESLGKKAAEALRAIDKVRAAHEATKRPSEAAEILESALTFGQAADLVNAALPVLTELAGLIEGKVQSEVEKARERERRQQVEAR